MTLEELCCRRELRNGMIVEGDVGSRGLYVCFVFKMGEITLCVYADRNCPVDRGKLMMQEKGDNLV